MLCCVCLLLKSSANTYVLQLAEHGVGSADPMHVLRAIRFGARLDFTLDEELEEAAALPEVSFQLARHGLEVLKA